MLDQEQKFMQKQILNYFGAATERKKFLEENLEVRMAVLNKDRENFIEEFADSIITGFHMLDVFEVDYSEVDLMITKKLLRTIKAIRDNQVKTLELAALNSKIDRIKAIKRAMY